MGSPTPPAAPGPTQPAPGLGIPDPQPPGQPDSQPPAGPQPGPGQPEPPKPPADPAAELAKVQAVLDSERRARRKAEADLAQVQQAHMTDADKALAKARDEGNAEAQQAAGLRVAAAEFVAAATGKPLGQYVDKLTTALPAPAPPGGKVPAGARGPANDGDFLGTMLR